MKHIKLFPLLFLPLLTFGQAPDYSRYTDRLADWLWKDQIRSAFIDNETKETLTAKIHLLDSVWKDTDTSSLGNKLYKEINATLNSKFSLSDLELGASIVNSSSKNLAVQLDPLFKSQDIRVLLDAAKLFLQIYLDDVVINGI